MKITLGEVIERSNVAELLSGGAVIEISREGHTGCGFLIWRMEDDERSPEQEQFAHDLVAALDELTELRAFKRACEQQGAVVELDDGFYHCPKCGIVAAKDHGRSDGAWCGYDAKWVQGPFYVHPDPEAASLRMRVKELEGRLVSSAIPEGWKLVPVEPTEEMHIAACKALVRSYGLDGTPRRVLHAMIAAAPVAGGS
jgi:hypothetical protein